ncbi:hypothetical protein J23TS9_27510 [Paenibacillus sp. J23TS9]|uniref:hypothetical protein n=1 Tax=Paenibacillus sp. J23TS9 TaxID=2807193 RepID=UPI001B108DAA|nr:hypothetical protein [Paenibacillus sp. J23TS9]GIP27621.1 hypothetical protein J23TS9_27510 [Paenibacillus sp. J23TS9]
MKKWVLLLLVVVYGLFFQIDITNADFQLQKPLLTREDILSVKVNGLYGRSRLFRENDGYEEVIIYKIINWINTLNLSVGPTEFELNKTSTLPNLRINMKNGNVSVIEPAYNCLSSSKTKICTLAEGEVIYTWNSKKVRLQSRELFDWLLVGWKYESVGASKDELLEETLYSRYYPYFDKTYSNFIMCPRIDKIERINGDTRRHIVHVSALNYSAHHGDIPYDRIHVTLSDTPENGVKIIKVGIEKDLSKKESAGQCRREN